MYVGKTKPNTWWILFLYPEVVLSDGFVLHKDPTVLLLYSSINLDQQKQTLKMI